MSRLQRFLAPRKLTWLDVAAICAAVLGAWNIASQVQQGWYGARFSSVPYNMFLALFALICLFAGFIGTRAAMDLKKRAEQLRK